MAKKKTGPAAAVRGMAEDMKGKLKEAAGTATGNESMRREGKAEQDKAGAEREVAASEAEAEKARAKAKADEARQRAHGQ